MNKSTQPSVMSISTNDPRDFTDRIDRLVHRGYAVVDVSWRRRWLWTIEYNACFVLISKSQPNISLNMVIGPVSQRRIKPESLINDIRTTIKPKQTEKASIMITLTDIQQVPLAIAPKDAAGNPAPVQNVVWSSSDPTIVAVHASDDGLSATAVTQGPLGVVQITVTADADMTDGVKEISGTLDIEVKASDAVSVGIAAGVPTSRPLV